MVLGLLTFLSGCQSFRQYGALTSQPGLPVNQPQYANPLAVPMIDRWAMMDLVSDEVDNYFRIDREDRIRLHDGIMSEGWIETHPEIGSTLFEPWRRDSTPGFEKLHATLQTVRRTAKVRVVPVNNQYQIDVQVFKDVEDMPQPLGASVGGKLVRHDSSLDIDREELSIESQTDGWIPIGRDFYLEQKILSNIYNRVAGLCAQ